MSTSWSNCDICEDYFTKREHVLEPAMTEHSRQTGEARPLTFLRFMRGVHDRHLSGLPILPERAA